MSIKSATIIIAGHEFKFDADLLSGYLEDCIEIDTEMGYCYRTGRGRGKSLEREITFDNCMRYDFRVIKKLEIDFEKEYSTQWILKDGQLYLKSFDAYANNQKVNLNTLFPDLFSTPSPVQAYWVYSHIRINLGRYANYVYNFIKIEIEQGHISEIYHWMPLTERKISEQQLHELIRSYANMSLFQSKVSYYMAWGLNEYDIVKKIMPVHLYNGELDSITVRLLDVMRKYAIYFKRLLCCYYHFTREMLKNYQSCLNWHELSGNVFLDWDEELLMDFKDRWDWSSITLSIIGITGLKSADLIIRYHNMGLIKIYEITELLHFYAKDFHDDFDDICSYVNSFFTEYQTQILKSKMEELQGELKKVVIHRIKKHEEWLLSLTESQKPAEELEQVISFFERNGDIFDERTFQNSSQRNLSYWENICLSESSYPFSCNNSLGNGLDYTFNTPEKRKVLDEAVEMFLIEESLRLQIRKVWKSAI